MITLPQIELQKILIRNSLICKRRIFEFSLNGKDYLFSFISKKFEFTPAFCLKLKISSGSFYFSLCPPAPPLSLFSEDNSLVLNDLPNDILNLTWEAFLSELLNKLEAAIKEKIEIEEVFSSPPPPVDQQLYFTIQNANFGTEWTGYIGLNEDLLPFFSKKLEEISPQQNPIFSKIPFDFIISIGKTLLSKEDYRNIALHDIVLIDNCETVLDASMNFRILGGVEFFAKLNHPILNMDTINTTAIENASPDVATVTTAPQPISSSKFDALPVTISFDVGEHKMTFGELQTLESGYTFQLNTPIKNPITIRANDMIIGQGELVQVGEKLGVHVTEFFDHDGF